MTFRNLLALGLCATVAAIGACGDDDKDEGSDEAPVNTCEAAVSYESVGKPFVDKYCISCHSKSSSDRVGAPDDVNFDTLAGITEHGSHVAEEVAEEMMPPKTAKTQPSAAERADFTDWLDCSGIAALEHHH
jgi:uncharacterized membrane protein